MTPANWIGLATLAFIMLVELIGLAFILGGLFNRVKTLEREQRDAAETGRVLPKLEATLEALSKGVERMDQTLTKIMQGEIRIPSAGRRREVA